MRIFPRKYFINPFIIALAALLIFTPIYLFITPKYNLDTVSSEQNTRYTYYYDLNYDGVCEKIDYYGYHLSDSYKRTTVILKNQNNSIKGIWNHNGRFLLHSKPFFTDYDSDNEAEIFTFHRRGDSIFLNGINPERRDKFFLTDRLLDTSQLVNGTVDLKIYNISTHDSNADGYKELVFTINAGFSLQPRNLYTYDIKNDSLIKSPANYVHFGGTEAITADLDDDGNLEYIMQTHASANLINTDVPYPDNKSYLMVLNENLEFAFKPYEVHSSLSTLYSYPLKYQGNKYILSYFQSYDDAPMDSLMLFNTRGKQIASRPLDEKGARLLFPTDYAGNGLNFLKTPRAIFSNGNVAEYDTQLQTVRRYKLPFEKIFLLLPIQIWINTQPGYAIISKNKVSFTNANLDIVAQTPIENITGLKHITIVTRGQNKRPYYFLQSSEKKYLLDLHFNKWYSHWWIVILIAGFLFWLIAYLIKTAFTLVKEYNMSKVLTEREDHKTQLARELHDELGSRITGLKLKIASLQQDKFQNDLQELSVDLQKTHEEVRSIIYNLAPPHIAGSNFYILIKQLTDNYKTLNSFQIKLECLPDYNIFDNLDDFLQKELYRVVQEALNNAAKHARASEVIIQFFKRGDVLECFIDDNGVGFETEKSFNRMKGQGIKSMETRVKMLKGHFHIYAATNKGTGIAIQVPIKSQKNDRKELFSFISRRPQYHYRRSKSANKKRL